MRFQTSSLSAGAIDTQCATSTTERPQPRQISSNVVEQTATQGVSGRSGSFSSSFITSLFCWADIERVPAVMAELFHRFNVLVEDLARFWESVDRALDAVFAQQVQNRVRRAVGVVADVVDVGLG